MSDDADLPPAPSVTAAREATLRAAKIHNEKRKLRATFLNGAGIAAIALGVARPLFDGAQMTFEQVGTMFVAVIAGIVLHLVAVRALNNMKSED